MGFTRNRFYGSEGMSKFYGVPAGYLHPYAWSLPVQAGGMASRRESLAELSTSNSNANLGYPVESTITGQGDFVLADLGLIVSGVASITGGILAASMGLQGILYAQAALSGAIAIVGNSLGAEAGGIATITASLSPSSIVLIARAFMGAAITQSESVALSVEDIARAVWESNPSVYNDPATYGKLIKQIKGMIAAGL